MMKRAAIKNIALAIVSILISFGVAEIAAQAFFGQEDSALESYRSRVMLYQQGENFQNIGDIFKYYPNREIRTKAVYLNSDKTTLEPVYDYVLETNNLGLVQKNDIAHGETVDIFVGDSFTEGQGASPWFYDLEANWTSSESKPVNAGILGTGPQQWKRLVDHLVHDYDLNIRSITVIMILRDLNRTIWNFSDDVIQCLRTGICTYSSGFQGFGFAGKSNEQIAADVIKTSRALPDTPDQQKSANRFSWKKFWKKSVLLKHVRRAIDERFPDRGKPMSATTKKNIEAIEQLVNSGHIPGGVLMIPTRESLGVANFVRNDSDGRHLLEWVDANEIRYAVCDLDEADFHENDPHLNAGGYEKVRACAAALLTE